MPGNGNDGITEDDLIQTDSEKEDELDETSDDIDEEDFDMMCENYQSPDRSKRYRKAHFSDILSIHWT